MECMPTRKTVSLYLSLSVIGCAWLFSLLTLSRMKTVAALSLTHLSQVILLMTVVTWVVILLLLKIQGEGLDSIGLDREKWRKSLVPGLLLGLGNFVVQIFVLSPLARWCLPNSEAPSFNHWFQDPRAVPLWLLLASIAGLKEEPTRSFILTRFEKAFGRKGLMIGLILQTIMFGIGHLYQGKAAAVVTGIVGLMYALIYLRRKSCWEATIAHSTYDMVAVGLIIFALRASGAPHH